MSRNDQMFADRNLGLTYRQLGIKYGLSGNRCSQIIYRTERIIERRKLGRNSLWRRAHLARIMDPGGPRGVLLVFHIGDNQP